MKYVQVIDDEVIAIFSCLQDPDIWPGIAEVTDDDPRYLAFIATIPEGLII